MVDHLDELVVGGVALGLVRVFVAKITAVLLVGFRLQLAVLLDDGCEAAGEPPASSPLPFMLRGSYRGPCSYGQ